jgi:lysozyme family protein
MAQLKQALQQLFGDEGGYANDPDDTGGETWCGISRVNNPAWQGWAIVDSAKKGNAAFELKDWKAFSRLLAGMAGLESLVETFYRARYWRYDDVPDQVVAQKLFNEDVNMEASSNGPVTEVLQEALTALGYSIGHDGDWGPSTQAALGAELAGAGSEPLLHQLRARLALRYAKILAARAADAKFGLTWMLRATE